MGSTGLIAEVSLNQCKKIMNVIYNSSVNTTQYVSIGKQQIYLTTNEQHVYNLS